MRARSVPCSPAVLALRLLFVDEGSHARHLDVVRVEEIVAEVELVEGERDYEGREIWWLLGFGADEGYDMVGSRDRKKIRLVGARYGRGDSCSTWS